MSVTDPIADMLTRIRNAVTAQHDSVLVPLSRTKLDIAKVLKEEGFIQDYEVSKPGLRVYVKSGEIPRLYGGIGVAIVSTSRGVMTGMEARRRKLGGELLCYVW